MNWLAGQQLLRRDESVVGCDFNIWSWQCIGCCWLLFLPLNLWSLTYQTWFWNQGVCRHSSGGKEDNCLLLLSALVPTVLFIISLSFSDLTVGRQFFYFFSFIRCPPCRLFTPVLAEFYSVSFYSPYPRIHLFFLLHLWRFSSKNTKIHNKLMIPKK